MGARAINVEGDAVEKLLVVVRFVSASKYGAGAGERNYHHVDDWRAICPAGE